jgi:F-type H+-transporting ATPase subunit gamma
VSERYGQITERIEAVRQLGAVVNVMRGTAGARAAQARSGIGAVQGHAAVLQEAIRRVLALLPGPLDGAAPRAGTARVVFGAEQGFVGGFTERVLNGLGSEVHDGPILLIGTRAAVFAAERGIETAWQGAMPLHIAGIPALADRIVDALFQLVAGGGIQRLEAVWASPEGPSPRESTVARRQLFPLRSESFSEAPPTRRPYLYRTPEALLQDLTEEHVHAQLCEVALRAFAAENETRMTVMTAAHRQVERRMEELQAERRQLRQQEITAEIIELSTGILQARDNREEGT